MSRRQPVLLGAWMLRLLGAGALLLLMLAAACAPVEAPAGPEIATPALHASQLVMADGTALPLRAWLPAGDAPPRAAVLALHGFNDYSAFFSGLGGYLAEQGIAAYAYDQRGFGEAPNRGLWPGAAVLADDLRTAIVLLRDRHPGVPLYVFGESMGGAVAMVALAEPPGDDAASTAGVRLVEPAAADAGTAMTPAAAGAAVDGVILAAPAVWGRSSMPWYQTTALWMAVHTFPWSRWSGRGFGVVASDNVAMLRALGADPLVIKRTRIDAVYGLVGLMDGAMAAAPRFGERTLLLYGANDQLIPAGAIDELRERLPAETASDRRYAVYPLGWHMLIRDLQAETVWRDIAAWIAAPEAPLPSGVER